MRILFFVLAGIFMLFAFVQVNDPDPILWILIYGSIAVFCVLSAFSIYFPKATIGLTIILTIYSFTLYNGVYVWLEHNDKMIIFDDIAKMQYPFVEEAREFLGLWIGILVLVLIFIVSWKKRRLHE